MDEAFHFYWREDAGTPQENLAMVERYVDFIARHRKTMFRRRPQILADGSAIARFSCVDEPGDWSDAESLGEGVEMRWLGEKA
jgi:hypothetical protein